MIYFLIFKYTKNDNYVYNFGQIIVCDDYFMKYNLLKNSNKIYKYYDFEFSNILLDINKKIKITELSKLPSYNINIIDLYNYINIINNNDFKYIEEIFKEFQPGICVRE